MKMLYLMAVDWYWIKQRPQFLAAKLEEDYELTVVYLTEIIQKLKLNKEEAAVRDCRKVPAVPFRDKNKLASAIERLFIRAAAGEINKYDIVWISYPTLFKYIDKNYKGKIIYDCMDNHDAFSTDRRIRNEILKEERRLVARADYVFTTSAFLKDKIENIGGGGKTYLVRNGFDSKRVISPQKPEKRQRYQIGYYGTIAEWMDFESVIGSLKGNTPLEYHFLGPVNHVKEPDNPGIIFEGIVEHSRLFEKTKDYDCLIMPFIVNDIIKAVDPVKLYEYIAMGKCIISVWYEEITRFEPYVYFYHTEKELNEVIEKLCDEGFPPKFTEAQQKLFLKDNSWETRYREVKDVLVQ